MDWVETAPTPARTNGHAAPTAKALVATATANAPVFGSCATMDQVMAAVPALCRSSDDPPLLQCGETLTPLSTRPCNDNVSDPGVPGGAPACSQPVSGPIVIIAAMIRAIFLGILSGLSKRGRVSLRREDVLPWVAAKGEDHR